jgi:cytochrome oxidase assembly protein ShyY1
VYRFLATPRWVGFAALAVLLSAIMTFLGFWQLSRYHARHTINLRIDHANATAPVPIDSVIGPSLAAPGTKEWTRVTVTGTYDPAHTVVARDRSVDGVGFEILVPLDRPDGTTVLVDRGFVQATGDALQAPVVPPVPLGTVTVAGRIHLPESDADSPVRVGDETTVRRIDPRKIAPVLGSGRTYADYLLLDAQTPPAAAGFERIPADRQPAWLNAGYTVQWWLFALMVLAAYGWGARREARTRRDGGAPAKRPVAPRVPRSKDRLGEDAEPLPLV